MIRLLIHRCRSIRLLYQEGLKELKIKELELEFRTQKCTKYFFLNLNVRDIGNINKGDRLIFELFYFLTHGIRRIQIIHSRVSIFHGRGFMERGRNNKTDGKENTRPADPFTVANE